MWHSYSTAMSQHAASPIARFMGPTWGPSGADRTQIGPMLAPWTLLPGLFFSACQNNWFHPCLSGMFYWHCSAYCCHSTIKKLNDTGKWITWINLFVINIQILFCNGKSYLGKYVSPKYTSHTWLSVAIYCEGPGVVTVNFKGPAQILGCIRPLAQI